MQLNSVTYHNEFETVCHIIDWHRSRTLRKVHNESLLMIWEVGCYVSHRLKQESWGSGVVRMLSEYIRTKNPTVKGWSYRTIYKMVQWYDTYSSIEFKNLMEKYGISEIPSIGERVPIELAQIETEPIMPIELAQFIQTQEPFEQVKIPPVLLATSWSNHQYILTQCKTLEHNLFYILYAGREKLEYKQLVRAIKTDTMTSLLGAKDVQSRSMLATYPHAGVLFKDTVYFEMFGLPIKYKETKLRRSIVSHMKDFILEMGKDFLFIDQEHRITVGSKTFKVDLLFYHRLLQCMVVIELKTTEFQPKDLGQLEFYLEALDKEERRTNENPSIGILMCKDADMDVVRYALNRSMSPTMITLYKEQLQEGGVIQRSLVEYCNYLKQETTKEG